MILINPKGQKIKEFYRYLPISPHIGIGVLAAYLLRSGKKVKIIDENVSYIDLELIDHYLQDMSTPYIFGISCVTAAIERGYYLAKILKEKYRDSLVIFGGIHPTVLPEEVIETGYVDIVVRGEGEETLSNLYDIVKSGNDYSAVAGISFKANGRIFHNPPAPLISDLNLLPSFPYYLFHDASKRYNLGFVVSSRGCPYDCIFCSQRLISGRRYRYVASERIVEELDLLINKYKQNTILFMDDNFLVNKNRINKLCELIVKRRLHHDCSFHCQGRADMVDEEILSTLRKANFKYIDFGIETASERLMKMLNKNETVQDNINAVKLAKKFGFKVLATFILGLPTETETERRLAYKLAKSLKIDYVRFNNATPYPGTKLFEIAKSENALNIDKNWRNLNACGSLVGGYFNRINLPYVPKGTDENKLKRYIFKVNLLFYLRPVSILKIFKEGMIPAGWLVLPKKWYLKPKEWFGLFKLFLSLITPRNENLA